MSLSISPFVAALPLPHHLLFEYDEDGDAIMTDATTGERLTYGRPRRGSTGTLVASPVAAPPPSPPAAPAREPRPSAEDDESAMEDDHAAVRNLAREMAEAVLEGEPREPNPSAPPAGEPIAEEGAAIAPAQEEPQGWCMSVTVSDLALRLDMRHPRVVLNLLRFVETYNELAPEGEEIHMPLLPQDSAQHILSHESVLNPAPEFAAEVAELRALVSRYSCHCADCNPEEYDDDDRHSYDSDASYRRRRRYDSC